MTKSGSLLIVVLCAGAACCDSRAPLPPPQPQKASTMQEIDEFARTIAQIGTEVKSLELADELFASRSFRHLYEHPQDYQAAATALIALREESTHHKKIAGYAMQRLPPEQFVLFVSALADNVERDNLGMDVLETVAFAPLNWGRQSLLRYYREPPVRAFLERLLAMPGLTPYRRDYIRNDILTGKAVEDYLDYMDMLGRPVED